MFFRFKQNWTSGFLARKIHPTDSLSKNAQQHQESLPSTRLALCPPNPKLLLIVT
tara:strand:+ start:369 stop:533 length:165 start_codon:yes stop_codon:yes gene_type:complete